MLERKHTLLHYLADLIEKKFPNINGFEQELDQMDDGSKVTLQQIRQSLTTIRENLARVKKLLEEIEQDEKKKTSGNDGESGSSGFGKIFGSGKPKQDQSTQSKTTGKLASFSIGYNKFLLQDDRSSMGFLKHMTDFFKTSSLLFKATEEKFKQAEKEYEQVVLMFGEDFKTLSPEEFFGIFSKFIATFSLAKKENSDAILKKIAEQKKEADIKVWFSKEYLINSKEREDRKKKKNAPKASNNAAASAGKGATQKDEGGLDDLISAIRSGKAFGGHIEDRKRRNNETIVKRTQRPHAQ